MTYPHCHKTVLVLDRGPFFEKSSQQPIDFDVFTKGRGGPSLVPLPPICKTMWTCNVEACMEFCRIIYDLHPEDRCIKCIISDTSSRILNSWTKAEQNTQHLMSSFAQCSQPGSNKQDSTIVHGLTQAVEDLCQITELQQRLLLNAEKPLLNNCRIICLTHLKSQQEMRLLEECVQDAIVEHNKIAADNSRLLPIDNLDLVVLHIIPVNSPTALNVRQKRTVSPVLSTELHVSQSGQFIAHKMVEMCTTHFTLCSTTVTGIPMKEEQNASSSANYDVELLHSSNVHDDLFKQGCAEGMIIPSKEGLYIKTVTLKWCTPKTNSVELQQCTGAYRFTPVDVNSRPSSCLTNFLLNGRSVMLEQPRKSGARVISHMLTSHGGELYIHVLSTARSILEDPPSISEGCGGRVTDYRINDFIELMKECRLLPVHDASSWPELPIDRARDHLERLTRYWPMTISETIIFNMLSYIDPLHTLIVKESLTDEDVLECKKAIYHVVGMETRNEPLPVQSSGNRGKGPKREEQYRQMWQELEKFVRTQSDNSPKHQQVLDCLLECRKSEDVVVKTEQKMEETIHTTTNTTATTPEEKKPGESQLEQTWKEYDRFSKMTEREKQEWNKSDVKRPDSPPVKKIKTERIFPKGSGPQSVLSLWTSRINALQNSRCNEFVGREQQGEKAELYQNMKDENMTVDTSGTNTGKSDKSKK